jgi:acetyl esterase/lipase
MILYNPALAIAPHESLPQEQNLKLARRGKESKIPLKQISPLWHASKSQPPCVIFFGTEDKLLESGQAFQKLSQAAGNSCELITFEGAGHGFFNNSKYQSLTNQAMKKFLVNIDWVKK